MNDSTDQKTSVSCICGQVQLPLTGAAIMSVACYCSSCQRAAELLAGDDRTSMQAADGGTPYVVYRKDRVGSSRAADLLCEHRLTPESSTRRVLSICCGTPLFLEFQNGHWLSLYSARVPEGVRPHTQLRTMIKDAPPGTHFRDGIPSYKTHSFGFMVRLLWAWVQMGFRAPTVDVRGKSCSLQRLPPDNVRT